ncbi:MAG: hypothetical protein JNL96_12725 [Planctomycetaceae bacterium]|nr:hypothetical protein [Planctomycetaceae bacterium]
MSLRWFPRTCRRLLSGKVARSLAFIMAGLSPMAAAAQQPEPPSLLAAARAETLDRTQPFAQPVAAQQAGYSAANYAAMEERLRLLEEQYEDQQMRFAALAEEKQDAKAATAKGTIVGSDTKMGGKWKEGAALETEDKAFKVKWRGRTQFDTSGWSDASGSYFRGLSGNQGDTAVDFRRLRLGTEGTIYEQFDFAVELDFINSFNTNGSTNQFAPNNNIKNAYDRQFFGVPAPTDVWVGMHDVPLFGNFRVGNVKPCNGLEHANSSRFLDFMERSLNQDAFVGRFNNGFQPGVVMWNYNEDQTMTFHSSLCANSYNVFAYEAGGYDAAQRLTWTPVYDEESHGRYMVHVGCSVTERQCVDGQARIRARPSLRNGISQSWSSVADTTIFFSDQEYLVVPEIAVLAGPWQFQAEYFGQWNQNVHVNTSAVNLAQGPNLGTAYFQGYYAQVGYFLTGEHREYERKTASFGRVVPYENFHFIKNGRGRALLTGGAWQLLYRYTLLDLNDPRLANVNSFSAGAVNGVGGGTVYDHTIGLNHFLNPNMKLQYNFVISDRGPSAASPAIGGQTQTGGTAYGFGARIALDF